MKTKNLILLFFLLIGFYGFSQPQDRMKNRDYKSLQKLYAMPWYKRLESNRYSIEGDPISKTGAVYSYLEHVKQNPGCVNPTKFAASKAHYDTIVRNYNQVIDYLIRDVNAITDVPVGELKIKITEYAEQYRKLEKDIPKFIADLEKELAESQDNCNRAAAVIPVETIMEYLIIPVIDMLKRRKLDQYRIIVVRELEKLKLDPATTWNEIENYLKKPSEYGSVPSAVIEDVYHLAELDYCKLLHIPMKTCYERIEIINQFEAQTADIRQIIVTLAENETNEANYYNELLESYKEARDALLSKCEVNNNAQDVEALKQRVKALILINDGCVPIDQLEIILR